MSRYYAELYEYLIYNGSSYEICTNKNYPLYGIANLWYQMVIWTT